jgi:methylated-DNA-[protein]-cysteine S-methyltransferase
MAVSRVTYAADGWGVGELWLLGERLLEHTLPRASGTEPQALVHPFGERFRRYFGGERMSFDDVEIEIESCTPFQRAMAETLRAVPYGETVTYGELAALAGYPGAHRAAGTFCARNRFALVVPCHRVVAAAGLGSYGELGTAYKRRLLELEGVAV